MPLTDNSSVDWEYPCDPQQGADFLALLAAVRIHLPEDYFLLTAALPAGLSVLRNIDVRRAADYVDLINVMAYDFFGPWTQKSGHHAQLYSTAKDETSGSTAVQYLMSQGFPARKILLGIPIYGRSFLNTSGAGHKFKGAGGEDGSFEYRELPRKGTKEQIDKRVVAAQCVGGDGGFVTYDNPDTVKIKAGFCKQKGLGVSYFLSLSHASPQIAKRWPARAANDTRSQPGPLLLDRASRLQRQQTKPSCRWLPCAAWLLRKTWVGRE